MIVRVKLFAVARQRLGQEEVQLEVAAGGGSAEPTVADLRSALKSRFPELAGVLPHVKVAVNSDYASERTAIPPDAEVALIPPVSGG